jgi:hypothetical protein
MKTTSTTSTPSTIADYLLRIDRRALDQQREALADIIDKLRASDHPSVCLFPVDTTVTDALEGILDLCDSIADQADCED